MKSPAYLAIFVLAFSSVAAQDTEPEPEPKPATPKTTEEGPTETGTPPTKLPPEEQISMFYNQCKEGSATEGLKEMLMANPTITKSNVTMVAEGFGKLVDQMGGFLDFEIRKKTEISKRTVVIRCIAHFERQPFSNEYTFYDPGDGDWRLVHLRYDGNLASMFLEDIRKDHREPSEVPPDKEK